MIKYNKKDDKYEIRYKTIQWEKENESGKIIKSEIESGVEYVIIILVESMAKLGSDFVYFICFFIES